MRMMDSRELKEYDPEELEEIRSLGDALVEIKEEEDFLKDNEVTKRLDALQASKKALSSKLRGLLAKRAPLGGKRFEIEGHMVTLSKVQETLVVHPEAIDDEVLAKYGHVEVYDRPLFVWTIDPRYLAEAINLKLVDQEELIAMGVIHVSIPTSKVQVRKGRFR